MFDNKSQKDSKKIRPKSYLKRKLNLNYIKWTNKTYTIGDRDMLHVVSPSVVNIDYLALYSNPKEYNKTAKTAVCFYEYDDVFDGKNGLWNSIYYNDVKKLNEFKKRFSNVRYFIMPDYTMCGDGFDTTNAYNIQRARIVMLWLVEECNTLVIPNITYADKRTFDYMFSGLEDCQIVAFSTKGSMKNKHQLNLLKEAIHHTIIKLAKLHTIIVYSVSTDNSKILDIFSEAITKNIKIIIPNNLLKERNLINGEKKNGEI